MAREMLKTAEHYVKQQVGKFGKRVPQKDIKEAIRKVAVALEEVRAARAESSGTINLK